jgi:hypothetical protein
MDKRVESRIEIKPRERVFFAENGYLLVRGLLAPGEVETLRRLGAGITARELEQEVLVPLAPGPNETPRRRRGWALDYADAKARRVYDSTFTYTNYTQTPDGPHLADSETFGNREYPLVGGREFPGCI